MLLLFSSKIREMVALKAEQEVTFTFMLDGKNQALICLSNIGDWKRKASSLVWNFQLERS